MLLATKRLNICVLILTNSIFAFYRQLTAQDISSLQTNQTAALLGRRYTPGKALSYEMTGSNHDWEYQIQANTLVKKDADGVFYEEIGWSNLRSNASMTLSPSSLAFRQTLSLDSTNYLAIPDLSKVQPSLVGPITDLLTFYSDLFLAKQLKITRVGEHIYFQHGKPSSWADGKRVLIGQDSIDFDLTLIDDDTSQHTATLLIRHVPPQHPQVQLPAKWMEMPVGDTANNWVLVERSGDKYLAQVGKELFEVRIRVDTLDGKILSAQLHNPVTSIVRECEDAALSKCGKPEANNTLREVNLTLRP